MNSVGIMVMGLLMVVGLWYLVRSLGTPDMGLAVVAGTIGASVAVALTQSMGRS